MSSTPTRSGALRRLRLVACAVRDGAGARGDGARAAGRDRHFRRDGAPRAAGCGTDGWAMDEVPADLRTNTLVDTHFSSGSMTSTTFYELQDEMKAAAEAEDYERAAYLKQLLAVLGPRKEPITLEDACPASADAQAAFFLEHGFVCVPSLEGAALERVQQAYLRVQTNYSIKHRAQTFYSTDPGPSCR